MDSNHPSLIVTKKEALERVQRDNNALGELDAEFANDRVVVVTSIREHPTSIRFAPMAFREDKEIVRMAIVAKNVRAFEYVSTGRDFGKTKRWC